MLIAVSGYARSGKDSIANILVDEHGFRRIAFADVMRDMLLAIDPIVYQVHPQKKRGLRERPEQNTRVSQLVAYKGWDYAKTEYPEIRRLLQTLGTDAGRRYLGENVWVDAAMRHVNAGDDVVFSDCRFTNEASATKARGGFVWRVNRPGVDAVNAHESERGLDTWRFDATIPNGGTLDQLAHRVEDALITCKTLINA